MTPNPGSSFASAASTALCGSLSTASRPSSGSSAIVWPFFTLRPVTVASRTAWVTCIVWASRLASVIARTFSSTGSDGSRPRSDAKPSAQFRVGTTWSGRSRHRGDLLRGEDHVRVVGQDQELVGGRVRDRLEELAGARVGALAAAHDADRDELPEAGGVLVEDRREAVRRGRPRRCPAGAGIGAGVGPARPRRARRPRPARRVARVRRATLLEERRRLRLPDVVRLAVEVLDRDPAERPDRQAVRDHAVGAVVVDVDLGQLAVARDEHRVADRLEVRLDRRDVERVALAARSR